MSRWADEQDAAKRHIGELSIENELLQTHTLEAEPHFSLATRRSRR